jgi:oligopeptide/dipeptide ABC transporter ATP-binding protein
MRIVEIDNLKVHFKIPGAKSHLRAVDGVSFALDKGESLGLVGESGCGKTTLGNAIIGQAPVTAGQVLFQGADITAFRGKALAGYRRQVQMIFQDPVGSLNPRMTIGSAIAEVLRVHRLAHGRSESSTRVAELLKAVGLEAGYASRYPHEFSGGQRQRVGIARALAVCPTVIIADEPVSALDVSVQVQILNLMRDLQREQNLSYLFIAHDLAVVRYMCDRILVMYLGRIVESAPTEALYERPSHPYTEALLSAVPDVDKGLRARKEGSRRIVLKGDVPSPVDVIAGCPFHPRCHRAKDICGKEMPAAKAVGDGHVSVCHFAEALARG